MSDEPLICEECEQEVDDLAQDGRFTGVCLSCEIELRREDEAFATGHNYVFGEEDYE